MAVIETIQADNDLNQPDVDQNSKRKIAVILVNLGTPVDTSFAGIWQFLKELLSDPRVVEVPRLIWLFILTCFILPFRTPRVRKAYKRIWEKDDSPLRSITKRQTQLLTEALEKTYPSEKITVAYAMNYCGPTLDDVVSDLEKQGVEHFIVLPLFPQYSASVTGTTFDTFARIIKKRRNIPQLHIIKQYYQHPSYIDALESKVRAHWAEQGQAKKLLFSFHSLPKRYVELGDPYYQQCKETADALVERLQLNDDQWQLCFQSRFLGGKWLSPYTAVTLEEWGKAGLESVDVFCPAFAADCLETIEEIDIENRERFIDAGGKQYSMIPCLNDDPKHIEMMAKVVADYMPTT